MNIQIFNKDGNEIRVALNENNELFFCLVDVCKTLELTTPAKVANAIKEEFELGELNSYSFDTGYGIKEFTMITEPQLYFVLMRSDKPNAKPFRKWVNCEVLPAIRKHGGYLTPAKLDEVLNDPDTMISLLQNLKIEREKRKALEAQNEANKPYISFAKSVEASVDSILIGTYAKLLSDSEGIKIGQNNLFDWLRAQGYLITGGARHNVPYQKYIDNGYFEVTTQTFAGTTGTHQRFITKITGKGQIALAQKIVHAFKRGA